MPEKITHETFAAYVNKIFRVRREGGDALELELSEVEVSGPGVQIEGMRTPFNLIFRGPPGPILEEGLHRLETDGGTSFDLYVIPILSFDKKNQQYQVVFN